VDAGIEKDLDVVGEIDLVVADATVDSAPHGADIAKEAAVGIDEVVVDYDADAANDLEVQVEMLQVEATGFAAAVVLPKVVQLVEMDHSGLVLLAASPHSSEEVTFETATEESNLYDRSLC